MRKALQVFIAACLTLSLATSIFASMSSALAANEGGFTYSVVGTAPNQTATITGYTGKSKVIVIPNVLGGYPVTSIGFRAFDGCRALTAVTIPNSIISIGDGAFVGCSSLTSVTIGNGVTSIGDAAFMDCTKLTGIALGSHVTSIGDNAFDNCASLTSITLPSSVTAIGDAAFMLCTVLTGLVVDPGNRSYSSTADGVLFDKAKTTLVAYPCGKRGAYVIPPSVTSIGDDAFLGCTLLTGITIPGSVTSIGHGTFYACSSLTSVTIPNGVISIGNSAFQGCSKLTKASFLGNAPKGTTDMFAGCAFGFMVHYAKGRSGWTDPWYGYPTTTLENPPKRPIVIVLRIGRSDFEVNGISGALWSPPVIKNGRAFVPIAGIMSALGGSSNGDMVTDKETVTLGSKTITLWIGKNTAAVNGISKPIDAMNAKVVPIIVDNGSMLPLRFVLENLGATVDWNAGTQTITVTYEPQ